MNFLSLAFQACIPPDREYSPYALFGEWSQEERDQIAVRLGRVLPASVDAMYNTWVLVRVSYPPRCYAQRASWDLGGWIADGLDAILDAIELSEGIWTLATLRAAFPDARIEPDQSGDDHQWTLSRGAITCRFRGYETATNPHIHMSNIEFAPVARDGN